VKIIYNMVTKIMSKSKNKTKFKSRKRKSMKKKINNRSMKGGAAKPPASKSSVATNPALVAVVAGKASTMSTTDTSKMAAGLSNQSKLQGFDPSKMGDPVTSEEILKHFQQEEDLIKQYGLMKFASSSGVPFGVPNAKGKLIEKILKERAAGAAEMMKKYDADPKAVNAEKARLESIIDPKMAQKIDPKLAGIDPPKTSGLEPLKTSSLAPNSKLASGLAPNSKLASGLAPNSKLASSLAPNSKLASGLAPNSKLASGLAQPSPQPRSKSIYGSSGPGKMAGMSGPGKMAGMSGPGKMAGMSGSIKVKPGKSFKR